LIVLNASGHLAEIYRLVREASAEVGASPHALPPDLLDLLAGTALVREAFSNVATHEVSTELVVPDVASVVAYVSSMNSVISMPGEAEEAEALIDQVRRIVSETITAEGAFRIRTASGCLVCK